jgi:hypothetical protein
MIEELNNVKRNIEKYENKLNDAEEKGDQNLILIYENRLIELSKKENFLLLQLSGMV